MNGLQKLAFEKVVQHLNSHEQMGMFITGPAGTGKSQILKAVKTMFRSVGEEDSVSIVSFMGSASSLVGGMNGKTCRTR